MTEQRTCSCRCGIKTRTAGYISEGIKNNMKYFKNFISLLIILGSFGSALADSSHTVVTTVPFDFVVGNQTLPAGTYSISPVSDGTNALRVGREDGTAAGIILPAGVDFISDHSSARLVFQNIGGTYYLTTIISDDRSYVFARQGAPARMPDPASTVVTSAGQ
jgi:hypothetical protein